MAFTSLASRIADLPLVLAGPMLRRCEPDSITVWIALKESRTVTLTVYHGTGAARSNLLMGSRKTIGLGQYLHVVAVTAVASSGATLSEGQVYFYELEFGNGQNLGSGIGIVDVPLTYGADERPSFSLPPLDLNKLRLVHGSCRKAHAESRDAMPALDLMIKATADRPEAEYANSRPHMLFLTGDQIYADDVADSLLLLLTDAGDALLGQNWPVGEPLPGLQPPDNTPTRLKPGERSKIVTDVARFTSGIPKRSIPKSHLIGLGEFYAMYLFAWSNVLWPQQIPDIGSSEEQHRVDDFRKTLPEVRRALANVPTYTILDDHEVTDDWFMNREWCNRILAKELGKRIIQNALLAYVLFQAWGNTPLQFSETDALGEPGRELLQAVENWNGSQSQEANDALTKIQKRIGLPMNPPGTASTLSRPEGALDWHYRVALPNYPFEIIVLDCRTAREYPERIGAGDIGDDMQPPHLMGLDAFANQIDSLPSVPDDGITFVISQAPVFGIPWIERKQKEAKGDDLWDKDAEAWGLQPLGFQRLIARLAMRRQRVLILSGDVHYSFAARIGYWASKPYGSSSALREKRVALLVQLNSSALKNQSSDRLYLVLPAGTTKLHKSGFSAWKGWPFYLETPERDDWAGWAYPLPPGSIVLGAHADAQWAVGLNDNPSMLRVSEKTLGSIIHVPEEWLYRIQFIPSKPLPSPPPSILNTMPQDPHEALRAIEAVHDGFRQALRDSAGREIVGVNNIGEITFNWQSGEEKTVTQKQWWRVADQADLIPLSEFTVSLNPNDPQFPPPDQIWH